MSRGARGSALFHPVAAPDFDPDDGGGGVMGVMGVPESARRIGIVLAPAATGGVVGVGGDGAVVARGVDSSAGGSPHDTGDRCAAFTKRSLV